jgi:hypothetical protein
MRQLAQTFAGTAGGPPLYVTLFTEFQTYPCKDNAFNADAQTTAYYRALKDRYMETLAIFHQLAPNARVSLGWGGWQARFDDPKTGAGRSMFAAFADVMRASDFQSFQAMQSDSNVEDVRAMVRTLGVYGPVMLAHYKPDKQLAGHLRARPAGYADRQLPGGGGQGRPVRLELYGQQEPGGVGRHLPVHARCRRALCKVKLKDES